MFRTTLSRFFGFQISVNPRMLFSKKPPQGFKVVVDREDVDDTMEFLSSWFVRDEPVIQTMGIEDHCDLLRYLKRNVTNGTTIKVVDSSNCETVGLALCLISRPRSSDSMRTFAECSICDQKTKRLVNFWADIGDSHNLYDCFNVQEVWDISILATAASMRGKGISKLLTHEAKLLGKKEGFSIARVECTSYVSAKLVSSMKFITFPPRHVLTYRDKKGTPWLPKSPPHPHGHVVVAYDFLT